MNVLFLDIDGVLNHEHLYRARKASGEQWPRHEQWIDRACVVRLNRVVAATGARVVISSSWRCYLGGHEPVAAVLRECGFAGDVIDATPDLSGRPEGALIHRSVDRWDEIEAWLLAHPEVSRYVILDDCAMNAPHDVFVRTDIEDGLTDADVDRAVRVLSDDWQALS